MSQKPRTLVRRAIAGYGRLTRDEMRTWLANEYFNDEQLPITDPVKVYLEAEYPGILIETGYVSMRVMDPATDTMEEIPVKDWHDQFMTKVINRWTVHRETERPQVSVADAIGMLEVGKTLFDRIRDLFPRQGKA